MIRIIFLLLVWAMAAASQNRTIRVDAGKVAGRIRSFQGVNGGPAPLLPVAADVTTQYRDLRIDIIRTHDIFGPTDIDARWSNPDPISKAVRASGANTIFPDWNADPEKESSYNFGPSDRIIGAIVESGARVYYRVGRSWGADPEPPADAAKFASIVKHVAMHYNAGWAKGHRYGIRYWEIWNEPDMEANWFPGFARPFWTGTPEQFYTLYEKVARALKEFDPSLKVGACGKAAANLPGPYREGLIRFCATRKVPLDFFSWHHYHDRSPDPYEMVRLGNQIREILDASGFTAAESHVTEWNMNLRMNNTGPLGQNSMNNAAFTAAALIYLQDSKVDRAFYYRGDIGAMGLFDPAGAYRKKAYAFKAAGAILDTPERLEVTGAGTQGFAVLAGRSTDGRKIQVLLAHFVAPPAGDASPGDYKLSMDNLPWRDARFTVKRYRLDQESDLSLASEQTENESLDLTGRLPSPGVELIVIERQ
jgi:xylan 1,4-beta-xylosidase